MLWYQDRDDVEPAEIMQNGDVEHCATAVDDERCATAADDERCAMTADDEHCAIAVDVGCFLYPITNDQGEK